MPSTGTDSSSSVRADARSCTDDDLMMIMEVLSGGEDE